MVIEALGLIIIVVAAWYIAAPLLGPAQRRPDADAGESWTELRRRRSTLYREIADLDFDYRTGKVATSDYQEQREEYLSEAAAILRALDTRAGATEGIEPTGVDAEIEREIQQLRGKEQGKEPRGASRARGRACSKRAPRRRAIRPRPHRRPRSEQSLRSTPSASTSESRR
jgi:hypothetical protein